MNQDCEAAERDRGFFNVSTRRSTILVASTSGAGVTRPSRLLRCGSSRQMHLWPGFRFVSVRSEMQPRCSRDAAEMQPRCSRDAAEMRPRCGRDAGEMRARYGQDSAEIRRDCRGCGVRLQRLLCLYGAPRAMSLSTVVIRALSLKNLTLIRFRYKRV